MFICTHSRIHCPENARECQNELIIIMKMLSKREKEKRDRERETAAICKISKPTQR